VKADKQGAKVVLDSKSDLKQREMNEGESAVNSVLGGQIALI